MKCVPRSERSPLIIKVEEPRGLWWLSFCQSSSYWVLAAAAAKSLQLCPTLCDPRDGRPPSSPIPGILRARTLEWVAISFSNAWKWKVKVKSLSRVQLLATPWTSKALYLAGRTTSNAFLQMTDRLKEWAQRWTQSNSKPTRQWYSANQ